MRTKNFYKMLLSTIILCFILITSASSKVCFLPEDPICDDPLEVGDSENEEENSCYLTELSCERYYGNKCKYDGKCWVLDINDSGCVENTFEECPNGYVCEKNDNCYKKVSCDKDNGYYETCPIGTSCTDTTGCYKVISCTSSDGYLDEKSCEKENVSCVQGDFCWFKDKSVSACSNEKGSSCLCEDGCKLILIDEIGLDKGVCLKSETTECWIPKKCPDRQYTSSEACTKNTNSTCSLQNSGCYMPNICEVINQDTISVLEKNKDKCFSKYDECVLEEGYDCFLERENCYMISKCYFDEEEYLTEENCLEHNSEAFECELDICGECWKPTDRCDPMKDEHVSEQRCLAVHSYNCELQENGCWKTRGPYIKEVKFYIDDISNMLEKFYNSSIYDINCKENYYLYPASKYQYSDNLDKIKSGDARRLIDGSYFTFSKVSSGLSSVGAREVSFNLSGIPIDLSETRNKLIGVDKTAMLSNDSYYFYFKANIVNDFGYEHPSSEIGKVMGIEWLYPEKITIENEDGSEQQIRMFPFDSSWFTKYNNSVYARCLKQEGILTSTYKTDEPIKLKNGANTIKVKWGWGNHTVLEK